MDIKTIIASVLIIIFNILFGTAIFISLNFTLLSTQKILAIIEESLLIYLLKKLLLGLFVSLIFTILVQLIWICSKRFLSLKVTSNKIIFKNQLIFFLLIAIVSIIVHFYFIYQNQDSWLILSTNEMDIHHYWIMLMLFLHYVLLCCQACRKTRQFN